MVRMEFELMTIRNVQLNQLIKHDHIVSKGFKNSFKYHELLDTILQMPSSVPHVLENQENSI